jgi:hypothetical protein
MRWAKTTTRVQQHTPERINDDIRRRTRERVARYARLSEDQLRRKADELEAEWDIERAIAAQTGAVTLGAVLLGRLVRRGFFAVAAVGSAFLIQHALIGWSPAVMLLRRMGFRTAQEIEQERHGLDAAMRIHEEKEREALAYAHDHYGARPD